MGERFRDVAVPVWQEVRLAYLPFLVLDAPPLKKSWLELLTGVHLSAAQAAAREALEAPMEEAVEVAAAGAEEEDVSGAFPPLPPPPSLR